MPGENEPGDLAGLNPPNSVAGENDAAAVEGVIAPLKGVCPHDIEPPYCGVAPLFHGVIAGDIDPELGVAAELNKLEGIIESNRAFTGIAIAFLHSSTLRRRSKHPVPILAS